MNPIPELENIPPEMPLSKIVKRLQEYLDKLRGMLEDNPSLRVEDILNPLLGSHEKKVRGVMFDIFHRVAKAMGRNSIDAIQEDARVTLNNLSFAIKFHIKKGMSAQESFDYIGKKIVPHLDPDMATLIAPRIGRNGKVYIPYTKPFFSFCEKLYLRIKVASTRNQ